MRDKGFTLIELLIVVAIIGIIAAIAIPSLLNAVDRARQTTSVANIEQLGEYTGQYIMDWRFVGSPKAGDIDELQNIFTATEINTNRSIIRDGWDVLFYYEANSTLGNQDYTIMSYGADGQDDGGALGTDVTEFWQDLIWVNGTWLQKPVGHQTSGN